MKLIIAMLASISVAYAADCTRIGQHIMCSNGASAVDIGNQRMWNDGTTETRIGQHTIRSDGTSAVDIGQHRFDTGPAGNSVQIGNMRMYDNGTTCQRIGSMTFCD